MDRARRNDAGRGTAPLQRTAARDPERVAADAAAHLAQPRARRNRQPGRHAVDPAARRLCADRSRPVAAEADHGTRTMGARQCRLDPRGAGPLRLRTGQSRGRVSTAPGQTQIQALLQRGDEFVREGDPRAAMSFYQEALAATRTGGTVDPGTLADLKRAQEFIQARAIEFTRSLQAAVGSVQPESALAKTRLTHALEMLGGKREIYPQQPSVFYYPYLAQRQYFEREEFEWVAELEALTPVIRDELVALINAD